MWEGYLKSRDLEQLPGGAHLPYQTVRADNATKVRFSATVEVELEVEVALV
jgi:hypothetical protein